MCLWNMTRFFGSKHYFFQKCWNQDYFAIVTLKHFHAICYNHIFLAIAPENRPVFPKRKNFQHYPHTSNHKVWKFIENLNFWLIHLTKCFHHIEIKWFAKQIYYFIKKFSYCFILFRCSKNNFGPLMRMLTYSPNLQQSLYQAYQWDQISYLLIVS